MCEERHGAWAINFCGFKGNSGMHVRQQYFCILFCTAWVAVALTLEDKLDKWEGQKCPDPNPINSLPFEQGSMIIPLGWLTSRPVVHEWRNGRRHSPVETVIWYGIMKVVSSAKVTTEPMHAKGVHMLQMVAKVRDAK